MAFISKSSEYGLRAALYVATRRNEKYVPIREISKDLKISFHFLTKILQRLTREGLMISCRGPSGGIALAKPAKKITLMDIIQAIEEKDLFESCILGLAGCGEKKPCPLHKYWARERKSMKAVFSKMTLDKLSGHVLKNKLRLAD